MSDPERDDTAGGEPEPAPDAHDLPLIAPHHATRLGAAAVVIAALIALWRCG